MCTFVYLYIHINDDEVCFEIAGVTTRSLHCEPTFTALTPRGARSPDRELHRPYTKRREKEKREQRERDINERENVHVPMRGFDARLAACISSTSIHPDVPRSYTNTSFDKQLLTWDDETLASIISDPHAYEIPSVCVSSNRDFGASTCECVWYMHMYIHLYKNCNENSLIEYMCSTG